MKGTLFSADFVKDSNGNLRLLELNTDTGITPSVLTHLDFVGFFNLLESLNITQLDVIYKKSIHLPFIIKLEEYVATDASFITVFNKHQEPISSIFPTQVDDSETKFILRLVYDETAIFDSVYCKQNDKLYDLFNDNNDLNSIAEFCLKRNGETVNNIRIETNSDAIPDLAVKGINNIHESIKFYKVGGTENINDNFSAFLNSIGDNKLITNYYETPNSQYQKSYRSFNIIYGPNLDVFNLTNVEIVSILDKPLSITFNENEVINEIDEKHYYEFATNYPNPNKSTTYKGGVFEEESILDEFGLPVLISDVVIGNRYKSLIVSGSPNTDNASVLSEWFHSGSVPPETTETTSELVNKISSNLTHKLIHNITTEDSSSFRANSLQTMLVYDSVKNGFEYKLVFNIEPGVDKLLKLDSSLIDITSNYIEVLNDSHKVHILDMENVDTFILHNSEINVSVVTHNACFPAGTKILLGDGKYELIENIKKNDVLISYNTETKKFESGTVGSVETSIQNILIEIKTDNGELLKSTIGHTIYTTEGWKLAKNLKVGDELLNKNEKITKIISLETLKEDVLVYHILNVNDTYNYFADDLLVHNYSYLVFSCFPAGTSITLADGSYKNIEDIAIGEEVMTYNEKTQLTETGVVGDLKVHDVNNLIDLSFGDIELTTTPEHPFFVKNKGWVMAENLKVNDICLTDDNTDSMITHIKKYKNKCKVYNLLSVSNNHNFFANKILVHNK
jgi:hypothetical protein